MQFLLERKKYTTYQALSATVHLEEWNRLFRHRKLIKISKRKIDSKVIESRQCSLERFHAVSIELNSEF